MNRESNMKAFKAEFLKYAKDFVSDQLSKCPEFLSPYEIREINEGFDTVISDGLYKAIKNARQADSEESYLTRRSNFLGELA